jgi:hypothetical protein
LTVSRAHATAILVTRLILLGILATVSLTGCEFDDDFLLGDSDPSVVYVQEPRQPAYYDPYYNRPKYYQEPAYFESTNKKTKGNKIYKTTTIRNEYGDTVYKETTSRKKKKK